MLPSAEEIQAAHAFLARRFGVQERLRDGAVRAALARAHVLARSWPPREETAALFYVLARRGRVLGRLRYTLVMLLAYNHARAMAHVLAATEAELHALHDAIAADRIAVDDVRTWFATRLRSIP
jgi:hypothetical protein